MTENDTPKVIGFRRWQLVLNGTISIIFVACIITFLFKASLEDLICLQGIGLITFGLLMAWFAQYNWRAFFRSFNTNIAIDMDEEGIQTHLLRPNISTKVYWRDVLDVKTAEQDIGFTSIQQIHIIVPDIEPYSSTQNWLMRLIRKYQKVNSITFVINVKELNTTPDEFLEYINEYRLAQKRADGIYKNF